MVLLFQPLTFAVKRGDEVLNYSQSTEAAQLGILNGIGFVDIKYTSGKEVIIIATLELSGGSSSEQATKREQLVLVPIHVNNTLLVEAKAKDGKNYWTWLRNNLNADKTRINYEIRVPESIKIVKVYNAVGNVTATGVKSALDIEVYTGHITGTLLSPQNYTNSITYTGNINMEYSNISNAALLKSSIVVGNITVKMPSGSNYAIDNNKVDPAPAKVDDVISDENINRVREWLLSTQQYTENTTTVANKASFGTVSVR
jgi:hypothetical protein